MSPDEITGQARELATRLMQNERISEKLGALHWATIDTSSARYRLLTSDRPVQLNGQLGNKHTTLMLPIGPDRLFVAAADASRIQTIRQHRANQLVSRSNQAVTQAANKLVIGIDDGMLDFVQRNFRRARPKPLVQRLIEEVAAKRGPGGFG